AGVRLVALEEDRELTGARGRALLRELEDGVPAAAAVVLDAGRVRVAGLVEEELLELRAGPEEPVLRRIERRAVGRLRSVVRLERRVPVDGGVVNRHPARREDAAVGVQRDLVGRLQRRLRGPRDRRACRVEHLQHLELAVVQVAWLLRDVAVDEAVRYPRDRARLARAAD